MVPNPRFRVDGLTHGTENANAGEVKLSRDLAAELHEGADSSWSGVEDRDFVLLDDFPPATRVRCVRGALEDNLGCTVSQGAVHNVGVTGNPAHVSCAPVHIGVCVQIEDVLVSERSLGEVATSGVQNTLGLTGGARGVEDKEGVLCRETLSNVLSVNASLGVIPPQVATLSPCDVVFATLDHEHVGYGASAAVGLQRCVNGWLEREDLALAPSAISGDHKLGFGVINTAAQAVCAEATEDNGVHCTNTSRRQHGDDSLRNHGHIDRNTVTGIYA